MEYLKKTKKLQGGSKLGNLFTKENRGDITTGVKAVGSIADTLINNTQSGEDEGLGIYNELNAKTAKSEAVADAVGDSALSIGMATGNPIGMGVGLGIYGGQKLLKGLGVFKSNITNDQKNLIQTTKNNRLVKENNIQRDNIYGDFNKQSKVYTGYNKGGIFKFESGNKLPIIKNTREEIIKNRGNLLLPSLRIEKKGNYEFKNHGITIDDLSEVEKKEKAIIALKGKKRAEQIKNYLKSVDAQEEKEYQAKLKNSKSIEHYKKEKLVNKIKPIKTVSELWKEKTGMDWSKAKELGITDGSKEENLKILAKLKKGYNYKDFVKESKENITYFDEYGNEKKDLINVSFKNGGIFKFNKGGAVILGGVRHHEKNELGDKGNPILNEEGVKVAETEREELLLTKAQTDSIEEIYNKIKKDSSNNELFKQLGIIIRDIIINQTKDNSGKFQKYLANGGHVFPKDLKEKKKSKESIMNNRKTAMWNNTNTYAYPYPIDNMVYKKGGIFKFQTGGLFNTNQTAYIDSVLNANKKIEWIQRFYEKNPQTLQTNKLKGFENASKYDKSTHLMSDNNEGYVFPSIVKENGKLVFKGDSAEQYARRTNTGIQLPKKEGTFFGRNGYKKGTGVLSGFQKGGNINQNEITKLGYKDNSPYKNNSFNDIYANTITMDGVSKTLKATSYDKLGKQLETKILTPNSGLYKFNSNTHFVREIPINQKGGSVFKFR